MEYAETIPRKLPATSAGTTLPIVLEDDFAVARSFAATMRVAGAGATVGA
jgi:hypothetical protein